MYLSREDIWVCVGYAISLLIIAYWISIKDKKESSQDYFLAGKSLPWWAIGASLIAANISAEQIIGMSGSGYAIGIAIASYEWMAAITLVIVAKFMLPIFLEKKIYTMPQYLEERYNSSVKLILAVFWLLVYVFVNLTAVLWLGGMSIQTITGIDALYGMLFLASFSLAYSAYGGLRTVAYTDIVQVVLLVMGGLLLSYLALEKIGDNAGAFAGLQVLYQTLPAHFDAILDPSNPHYISLPGISVLVGGLWVMNFSYWGFNQYIIQRALAAKNINEARNGIAFAAYLKLFMPLIVVIPGIAAVILFPNLSSPDQAYPSMMSLMPVGVKGLVFSALVAAIISSVASMTNSVSTIFTMDLYTKAVPDKTQDHYIWVGRFTTVIALVISLIVAKPLLGKFDQAFQYIQEFTGFFTPGIVVIFICGLFIPWVNSTGAMCAAIGSALFSVAFKLYLPDYPFIDRVGAVFILCLIACLFASLISRHGASSVDSQLRNNLFTTTRVFNTASVGIVLSLCAIYGFLW